jgi:hypothetical protein
MGYNFEFGTRGSQFVVKTNGIYVLDKISLVTKEARFMVHNDAHEAITPIKDVVAWTGLSSQQMDHVKVIHRTFEIPHLISMAKGAALAYDMATLESPMLCIVKETPYITDGERGYLLAYRKKSVLLCPWKMHRQHPILTKRAFLSEQGYLLIPMVDVLDGIQAKLGSFVDPFAIREAKDRNLRENKFIMVKLLQGASEEDEEVKGDGPDIAE